AFSPDSKHLATGSRDRKARIWDVLSGRELGQPFEHGDAVTSVAFSPDGKSLATGAEDGTTPDGKPLRGKARIWDFEGRRVRKELDDHSGSVTSVAFSVDGKSLATGFQDSTAWLWDTESGQRLAVLRGHDGPVTSVAFSPDGSHIATGSQ